MSVLILTVALWATAAWLWRRALAERPDSRPEVLTLIRAQALFVAPRLVVGMMGAGFYAALVPAETMEVWLGPESGLTGMAIAALGGIATPGGPIVGFAIAGALVGHAGDAQIIAFVSAWSLLSLNRYLVWESALMGNAWAAARLRATLPAAAALGLALLLLA